MTRDISPDISTIRLFLTEPHPCSYLDDKQATTAFVDPNLTIDNKLYSRLSDLGFRRSGRYIYTPRCENCNACVPVRIPVAAFKPNRSQQRCCKRNQDLICRITDQPDHSDHYRLYSRYINDRHSEGDMFPPSQQQYEDFIGSLWENSRVLEFRLNRKLIAAAVIDVLEQGISAIYTYFCPQQQHRSLGSFSILTQVALAKERQLPYVYLGYWIKDCRKMSYKTAFKPLEMRINNRWVIFKSLR